MKYKIRLTCSRCNKIGLFHTVDEIDYEVIGYNMVLNEEYYECPECRNKRLNRAKVLETWMKPKETKTYQEIEV